MINNYDFDLVFGRLPAELGPEARSNGSGSENGAERTQNWPRRPLLRPFRDHVEVPDPQLKIENVSLSEAEGPPSGPPPFLVEKIKVRAGPGEGLIGFQ